MMYNAMISHSGSSSFTHSWSFIFVPRHQSSRHCVLISLNFVWTPLKHLRWTRFLGRLRFIWSCQSRNSRSAGKLVAVGEARQPEKFLAKRVMRILFWCISAAFPIYLSLSLTSDDIFGGCKTCAFGSRRSRLHGPHRIDWYLSFAINFKGKWAIQCHSWWLFNVFHDFPSESKPSMDRWDKRICCNPENRWWREGIATDHLVRWVEDAKEALRQAC